jgi:hypothetical protein
MKDLYLSFLFKCLTFAATFPTAVLNKFLNMIQNAAGNRIRNTATLSSIAVGPKVRFLENAFDTI